MKRRAAVLIGWMLLALPSGFVRAQGESMLLESRASRALLDSARHHLLAYRMDDAERLLDSLSRRPEGRPAAWFFLTSAALHRALMTNQDAAFEIFDRRTDSLGTILSSEPASLWRDYMRAESDLWRAAAHLKRGRYVRGALAARSAYGGLSRVVAARPDFYDAYKGLGLLHLSIGSMPRSFRFVLKILGYRGTISQGLEELDVAFRKSIYSSEEAGIFLAFTKVMLSISDEEGLRILEQLYNDKPSSTLYGHLHGFMLIANRRTSDAAIVLKDAIRRSETPAYFYDHYLDFYLAEALFRNDRFDEAERYYRGYLDRHKGPALRAMALLGLGLSLEMQGERDEALVFYEEVHAARTFDTDEAARRKAARRMAAPMSRTEERLLLATNAYDSGRYDAALRILASLDNEAQLSRDERAEIAYRRGRIAHAENRLEEAVDHYERAVLLRGDSTSRWAPWAQFYVGKISEDQGRREDALEAYRVALSYGGKYDYYQALEQSARAAIELLEGR